MGGPVGDNVYRPQGECQVQHAGNQRQLRKTGKSLLQASQLDDPDVAGSQSDLPSANAPEVWKDPQQPVNVRGRRISSERLSLAEKARQLDLYDGNAVLNDDQKSRTGTRKNECDFWMQKRKGAKGWGILASGQSTMSTRRPAFITDYKNACDPIQPPGHSGPVH